MTELIAMGIVVSLLGWSISGAVLVFILHGFKEFGASEALRRWVLVIAGTFFLAPEILPIEITAWVPFPFALVVLLAVADGGLADIARNWGFWIPSTAITGALLYWLSIRFLHTPQDSERDAA